MDTLTVTFISPSPEANGVVGRTISELRKPCRGMAGNFTNTRAHPGKNASFVALAAAISAIALFSPPAIQARPKPCKGNSYTGCFRSGPEVVCSPVTVGTGASGHCEELGHRPKGERECVCVGAPPPPQVGSTNVVTYHNDPQRTGWNATENVLTTANVKHGSFGFYTHVALDDRIDTQPLVVGNVSIDGVAREVVYVATEGNTVYAIDPGAGNESLPPKAATVLIKRNLGPPVSWPLRCSDSGCLGRGCPDSSGGNVGINGTPTININSQTMYVIAYTSLSGKPTYQLHALDLRTLNDKSGSPVSVAASHTLTNGSKYIFDATIQRQRPGLLLADGNVYAGFGSFCDFNSASRGWLLGWNAGTLAPLPANELTDTETTAAGSPGCPASNPHCLLSSIWMSGYGLAAETPGDLFFVTVEAAQAAARFNPEWRSKFLHLAMRRERRIAKVAMARKLAVNLYWMWRKQRSLQPSVEVGSYAG